LKSYECIFKIFPSGELELNRFLQTQILISVCNGYQSNIKQQQTNQNQRPKRAAAKFPPWNPKCGCLHNNVCTRSPVTMVAALGSPHNSSLHLFSESLGLD